MSIWLARLMRTSQWLGLSESDDGYQAIRNTALVCVPHKGALERVMPGMCDDGGEASSRLVLVTQELDS